MQEREKERESESSLEGDLINSDVNDKKDIKNKSKVFDKAIVGFLIVVVLAFLVVPNIAPYVFVSEDVRSKNFILRELNHGDVFIAKEMYEEHFNEYGADDELKRKVDSRVRMEKQRLNDLRLAESIEESKLIPRITTARYRREQERSIPFYEKVEVESVRYSGDKVEFDVVNNSDVIVDYIKFDIYIYDENDNILDTDWTNWSGSLLSGGRAIVETYVTDGDSIRIVVDEVSEKTN